MESAVQSSRTAPRARDEVDVEQTPDHEQARQLLEFIAPGTPVTFQAFDDSDTKDPRLAKVLYGTFEQHKHTLADLNQRGAGIFFMVNEGNGGGRRAENVTRVRAVFVDLDENAMVGLAKIQMAKILPHAIVESSPDKFHCYWAVDCPLDSFTPVQEALALRFGSDLKVKDLPRVMRLPGFLHQKGAPFMTRVLGVAEVRAPIPIDTLVAGLELDHGAKQRQRKATDQARPGEGRIGKGGRNDALYKECCRLRGQGNDEEAILEAALGLNARRCDPPLDESEVRTIVGSAMKHEPNPVVAEKEAAVDLVNAEFFFTYYGGKLTAVYEKPAVLGNDGKLIEDKILTPVTRGDMKNFVREPTDRGDHGEGTSQAEPRKPLVRERPPALVRLSGVPSTSARQPEPVPVDRIQHMEGIRRRAAPWVLGALQDPHP